MATLASLRKAMGKYLSDYLSSHEMLIAKKTCRAYRVTNDGVYHIISIAALSSGKNARVFVTCTVPEVSEEPNEKSLIEGPLIMYTGGSLSEMGIGVGDFLDPDASSEEACQEFFKMLPEYLDRFAEPLFSSIQTRRDFWNALDEHSRKSLEGRGLKERVLRRA